MTSGDALSNGAGRSLSSDPTYLARWISMRELPTLRDSLTHDEAHS